MMTTPQQRHPSFGSPRAVVNEHGFIDIVWPDPRPAWFEMSSDLFEHLIAELNAGRRLAVTLEEANMVTDLIGAIDDYNQAADETDDASTRAHA